MITDGTTGRIMAPTDRNPIVSGQTRERNATYLGTLFRPADLNDKEDTTRRNATWGVNKDDIYCDVKARTSFITLGSKDATERCDEEDGGGHYFDGAEPAYFNRWYLDQTAYPGTPLWPAAARSEFGICCAYHYATFGTNGYREMTADHGIAYDRKTVTSAELKGSSAVKYNAFSASRGFSLTTPAFPKFYHNKLNMCWRDGIPIAANPLPVNLTAPLPTRSGNMCRVGDPNTENVVEYEGDPLRNPWDNWHPAPMPPLHIKTKVRRGTDAGKTVESVKIEQFDTLTVAERGNYTPGHTSCRAIRRAAGGVYNFRNIQPRKNKATIHRSFVPVVWGSDEWGSPRSTETECTDSTNEDILEKCLEDSATSGCCPGEESGVFFNSWSDGLEICREEQINYVTYSTLLKEFYGCKDKCDSKETCKPFRWHHNMVRKGQSDTCVDFVCVSEHYQLTFDGVGFNFLDDMQAELFPQTNITATSLCSQPDHWGGMVPLPIASLLDLRASNLSETFGLILTMDRLALLDTNQPNTPQV